MADDNEAKPAPAKTGGGHTKLVILAAVALFAAMLGAQVAAPIVNKLIAGDSAAAAPDEEPAADQEREVAKPADPSVSKEPALYAPLDPPFVVSFDTEDGARYLQLTLQAMSRSEKAISAVKTHAPAIRNAFLFLLSGHELEELTTQEGKEKLRKEMLAAAREIMVQNTGEPGIEDLYFTSLVIQ
jgi:flagellar protein FliL